MEWSIHVASATLSAKRRKIIHDDVFVEGGIPSFTRVICQGQQYCFISADLYATTCMVFQEFMLKTYEEQSGSKVLELKIPEEAAITTRALELVHNLLTYHEETVDGSTIELLVELVNAASWFGIESIVEGAKDQLRIFAKTYANCGAIYLQCQGNDILTEIEADSAEHIWSCGRYTWKLFELNCNSSDVLVHETYTRAFVKLLKYANNHQIPEEHIVSMLESCWDEVMSELIVLHFDYDKVDINKKTAAFLLYHTAPCEDDEKEEVEEEEDHAPTVREVAAKMMLKRWEEIVLRGPSSFVNKRYKPHHWKFLVDQMKKYELPHDVGQILVSMQSWCNHQCSNNEIETAKAALYVIRNLDLYELSEKMD